MGSSFDTNLHLPLLQALLQHGPPDQCFHSGSTPPSAQPERGEPVSHRPRPPRAVTFLHLHLSRPPGLKYRRATPQGQRTLGSAHPAEHPACRSSRQGGVLNTPEHQLSASSRLMVNLAGLPLWRNQPFIPLEANIDRPCYLMLPPRLAPPKFNRAPAEKLNIKKIVCGCFVAL